MTYTLRQSVLRPNQSIEESMYESDHEKESFHVGAFYEGKLVSTVSFIIENNAALSKEQQYRLRQMATLEEYRKLGAGRAIISFAENIINERDVNLLWC